MYHRQALQDRYSQFYSWISPYSERAEYMCSRYGVDVRTGLQVFDALLELAYIDSLVSSNPYEPVKSYKPIALCLMTRAYQAFERTLLPDEKTLIRMRNKKKARIESGRQQFMPAIDKLRYDLHHGHYQKLQARPEWEFPFDPDYSRSIPYLVRGPAVVMSPVHPGDPWESDEYLATAIGGMDIVLTTAAPELAQLIHDASDWARHLDYAIPPEGYSGMVNAVARLLEHNRKASVDLQLLTALEGLANALNGNLESSFDFSYDTCQPELTVEDIRYLYTVDRLERHLVHAKLRSALSNVSRYT